MVSVYFKSFISSFDWPGTSLGLDANQKQKHQIGKDNTTCWQHTQRYSHIQSRVGVREGEVVVTKKTTIKKLPLITFLYHCLLNIQNKTNKTQKSATFNECIL